MDNRLTKIAAIALLSLTAAAPMAMAYGVAPSGSVNALPVSVEPLGPQPDLAYQPVSTADANGSAGAVRIAELGAQPRMPFAQSYAETGAASAQIVTTGNLSATPANSH